jgi:hypothetical protein
MKKFYSFLLAAILSLAFVTVNAQVSLTATGGTLTGTYTTLKLAFDNINNGTHTGDIVINITANTVEGTTPAVLFTSGSDPIDYSSILIQPSVDGVSISGNPASGRGVIELKGADNVTINGDNPNTAGINKNLTINNTATTATTFGSVVRLANAPTGVPTTDNFTLTNTIINGNVTSGNASGITALTSSSNASFGFYAGGNGGVTDIDVPTAITDVAANTAPNLTTFANLIINNNTFNQCGRAIVVNGATTTVCAQATITNNTIGAAAALGAYPYTTPASTVYSKGIWVAGAGSTSLTITGNTIRNVISYLLLNVTGIELASNIGAGTLNINSNTITGVANNNNSAITNTATGILISNVGNKFNVNANTISTIHNNATAGVNGILINANGGTATISGNNISDVFQRNTGGYGAYGIQLAAAASGAAINNNFIYNIMNIGDFSFTPALCVAGVLLNSGNNHKVYHNSIHLYGANTGTGNNMMTCLAIGSNAFTGLDIRNNIFSNVATTGQTTDAHVGIYIPFAATNLNHTINNNAYFSAAGSQSGIAFAGSTGFIASNIYTAGNFNPASTAPITNFRSFSSALGASSNDFASFASTAAAPFISSTNLHVNPIVTPLESGGTPVGITTDYDNAARSGTAPDIGADDFAGTPSDLTAPLIVFTPLDGTCNVGANRTLTVTITDASGVPTSGVGLPRLFWKINAGAYVAVTGVSIGGGQYTFTFGAGTIVSDVVSYYIVAQDNIGNTIAQSSVGAAGFTSNPPNATTAPTTVDTYSVQNNLAPGTYLVGAGQTYTTITAAINAYNTSCLSGPIVFELNDNTYPSEVYPISIGNPVASAVNTLTIRPAATRTPVITGSNVDAIFKFNGADYVTIDGSNNGTNSRNLTITNTDAGTTAAVIWVASPTTTNGATFNTIKNTIITGSAANQTFGGIISSSGTTLGSIALTANNNNTYTNNQVTTSQYGIAVVGPNATESNTIINNNSISNLGFRGIFISNQTGITTNNNTITSITSNANSNSIVPSGIIVVGNISGGNIFANNISNLKNVNTGGWSIHGITLQATTTTSNLTIYNNFIYDVIGDGWLGNNQDNGHGIGILGGGGYNIYYNSINMTTNQITRAGPTAAIFIDNRTAAGVTPVNLNIRNNIFANQETTGTRYAIISAVPASSFTNINYNDYFAQNVGFLTSTRATIGAWQTATGQDGNSISINPQYVSLTDLHLGPTSTLNGQATPIGSISVDIDAQVRNATTPDMGADEFTPPNCTGPVTGGTVASNLLTLCVSGNIILTATGYTIGDGMTYQWQFFDGSSWVSVPGETNPSSANIIGLNVTRQYRLSATCSFAGPSTGVSTNTVTVTVNNPSITASSPASRCGFGAVTLSATGSAGTTINWYDAITDGNLLATNTTTYTTPNIGTTTTYYAQAFNSPTFNSVGPISPATQGGTINLATFTRQLIFNVTQTSTLVSVDIYPQTSGEAFTLELRNQFGAIQQTFSGTTSVGGGATPQTLTLNWPLTIGNGYYLTSPTMPGSGLYRNTSNSGYPYSSAGIDITGSDLLPYYVYYYNWQYTTACGSSPRTPVNATITSPPALTTLSATPASLCEGQSSSITANGTGYTSYVWSPGALSGATQSVSPTTSTTYTVTASGAPGGCATTGEVTVAVNPVPGAITISAPGTICAGDIATFIASGGNGTFFNERFETFPISKFVVTGSGVTENQNSTYFSEGSRSVLLTYTNNISTASPGSYETSSNINLSLYNNPELSFSQICALETSTFGTDFDFGFIEYSTDGGVTYTSFPTSAYIGTGVLKNGVVSFALSSYADWQAQFTSGSSTPGTAPATALWKLEKLNLTPWQASTQFKIRFRITSDVSDIFYGWLIDNVKITGQAAITWGPITELFTNASATLPYTALTNFPTVYSKQTAGRTYTATSSVGGCSSTASVTPVVTSRPISLTIAGDLASPICGGDTVKFTIPTQNIQGGTPVYNWKINGVTLTGSANTASSVGTLVTCASTANLYTGMRVTVTAGTGAFQPNTRIVGINNATQFVVSLTPVSALSGATIAGFGSGTVVNSIDISTLANGDIVTCELSVGGVLCIPVNPVTSNAIPYTVTATTPSSVSITQSPVGVVCAGASVTFTASTVVNGGINPQYEWFIGTTSVSGPSLVNTFTTTTLANGDIVTCRMTSNATNCPLPKKPISAGITVTVNPTTSVSVQLNSNVAPPASPTASICAGTTVIYTAVPTNGGATPQYTFKVNGSIVQGPNASATYTNAGTLLNGDVVLVELVSSITPCGLPSPATASITMTVSAGLTASVTISNTSAICTGISKTFTAVPTNGSTPEFQFWVNGTIQQAFSPLTTYSYTPTNGDVIRVDMNNTVPSCASPTTSTFSFTQTVNAIPTASIVGNTTICTGVPVFLNSNATAGSGSITSIQWRLAGTPIGGATATTYTALSAGVYDVVVQNSNTCTFTSATHTITASPVLMSGTYTIGALTATGGSGAGTTITVASTANLQVGAVVTVTAGTGAFAASTLITSIPNATTFTVSVAPSTALVGASIAATTCTNYISFANAINDLNTRSINGACIFNVTPGYIENLTAQLALGNATLSSASTTWPITFQKNGVGANPRINAYTGGTGTPATAAPDGIFSLRGMDNVTIDGIDVTENATNTGNALMEFGYGLFKLSATDGAQNNTIKNCVVTLSRVNNVNSIAPMVEGSVGILALNATAIAATTPLIPTANSGANSNNKFYSNTVQNGNHGLVLSGYAAPLTTTATGLFGDTNNDIGGASAATGNTVINFGGQAGTLTATAGIRTIHQWGVNISYNTLNNNNGSGIDHPNTIRGIWGQSGLNANATINNNNVTVKGGGTTQTVFGIENNIGNNTVATGGSSAGTTITVASTANLTAGMTVSVTTAIATGVFAPATTIVSITSATTFVVSTAPTTVLAGATIFGASNTLNINNNIVTGTYTTGTSGSFIGIANGISNPANASTLNMNSNTVQNVTLPLAFIGAFTGISNATSSANCPRFNTVNSNNVSNNTKSGSGSTIGIYLGNPLTGGTTTANNNTISNNTIVAGATTSSIQGMQLAGLSTYTVNGNTITINSITGITGAGVGTINGFNNSGGLQNETITNNIINNLFITGTSTGLHIIRGIFNNTNATSVRLVEGNTINNLYTSSGMSTTVTGIVSTVGGTVTVSKNYIYDLFAGQSSVVRGVHFNATNTSALIANTVVNNVIALDLTRANVSTGGVATDGVLTANDAVRGIDLATTVTSSTVTNNVYFNSINLVGTGFGVNFGSVGIFQSSNSANHIVDLRNNLIRNVMTPGGTSPGFTVAFKRAGITSTYASTSNNNSFDVGTSSTTRRLYFDGTTGYQDIAAYSAGVGGGRETASKDLPITYTSSINLIPTNSNCAADGAGQTIAGITTDFDGGLARTSPPDMGAYEFTSGTSSTLTVTAPTGCGSADLTAAAVTASSTATLFRYYDGTNTSLLATPNSVGTGNYTIRGFTGSCPSTPANITFTVTLATSGTWLGTTNTDWNNAANWCGGVPTSATNVIIPTTANNPVIANTQIANNVTITGTGILTIATGGNLQIAGSILSVSNPIIATAGTVTFNGSAAQTVNANHFSGSTIGTLVVNNTNASGLTINAGTGMLNIVTEVNFGNVNNQKLNTNNLLTLKSTATGTARISDVTLGGTRTGNDVVGQVVIERFIPARRAWRLLTAPIKSTTIPTPTISANWQEGGRSATLGAPANPFPGFGTHISSGLSSALNGFDQNVNNNASIFYLTPTGWNGKPTSTVGTTIGANNGVITDRNAYFLFVRGSRAIDLSQGPSAVADATTLRTSGLINVTSDAASPLVIPGQGAYVAGGNTYNSFPNPYPSAINFDLIKADALNGGVPNTYYVWDANLTGTNGFGGWVTVVRTGPGAYTTSPNTPSLNTGNLQSGMAIMMIHSGTITYKEQYKVSGSNISQYRPVRQIRTNLIAHNADGTESLNDGTLVTFDAANQNGIDPADAYKLPNFTENISINSKNANLSIERRQNLQANDTIFITMDKMRNKAYHFAFELDNMQYPAGKVAVLEDTYLQTATPINLTGATNVDFEVNSANAGSAQKDRFRIVFKDVIKYTSIKAYVADENITVDWKVSSELNIASYVIERSSNGGVSFESVGTQVSNGNSRDAVQYTWYDVNPTAGTYIYRVKCISNNGAIAYSDKATATIVKRGNGMYVFPNPVTNNVIGIQLNKVKKGIYTAVLKTKAGQIVMTTTISHAGGSAAYTIAPTNRLVSGNYTIEIIGDDNAVTVLKVIAQTK